MSLTLDSKIEAILFFKAEPVSVKKLAQILNVTEQEIKEGVALLEEKLLDRGIDLLHKDGEVMLGTSPDASAIIEGLVKEELSKDLGKAGLETLSIILYRGPVTRSKIDYIRGVSSTFILRNLLVRGLIERVSNPDDQRSFLYRPTFELLSYLGVSKIEDLPEYEETRKSLEAFEAQKEEKENTSADDTDTGNDKAEDEINSDDLPNEINNREINKNYE